MISLSIDVTELRKDRFRKLTNSKGKECVYLDLTLIDTPNSKYGDHYFAVQKSTKEERDNGLDLPILGNAKDWTRVDQEQMQTTPLPALDQSSPAITPTAADDDIPF